MAVLRFGSVYFLLVFAVGFVLGSVRVPLLEPTLGVRWAELLEAPFMWLAIYWAAGRIVSPGRLMRPANTLAAGVLALMLMLAVEFSFVLVLRGMTVEGWLAGRDAIATAVYGVSLVWFAVAPWWRYHRFLPGGGIHGAG